MVLWETFETIVLPRRVTRQFRLTRFFYQLNMAPMGMARFPAQQQQEEARFPAQLLRSSVTLAAARPVGCHAGGGIRPAALRSSR